MKIAFLILLTLLMSACNSTTKTSPPNALHQQWLNAYEENTTGNEHQLYRPATFKTFPPSRFRMRYTFNNDGSCQYLWLSPIDAHKTKPCSYRFQDNTLYLLSPDKQQKIATLKVLSLTKEKLELKKIN